MERILLAFTIMLGMSASAFADNGKNDPQLEADQKVCFGAKTKDECENNGKANCTWLTQMEDNGAVSWCVMTLPWTPKQ